MKRWPTSALLVLNMLIACLVASPAWAQPVPDVGLAGPAAELLKQGILGALVVLEGVVIWYLYKQAQMANTKFLDMAVKQAEILAEVTRTLKRNEELTERVLDVVIGKK